MLDVLLPLDCRQRGGVLLEIDEPLDAVSLCKSGNHPVAMLKHAPHEIIGHADVKRATGPPGKNVNPKAHSTLPRHRLLAVARLDPATRRIKKESAEEDGLPGQARQ